MKRLSFSLFFATALVGCGGGSDGAPASNYAQPSSSVASSVIVQRSSSSVTSSSTQSSSVSVPGLTLVSESFGSDLSIPSKYSCYGARISPHLRWTASSPDAKSFALIMEDVDAVAIVGHPYVHWSVYDIERNIHEIKEGATLNAMPLGSKQAINHDGTYHYSPPCPPEGTGIHHYYATLYALNIDKVTVDITHVLTRAQFEAQNAQYIIQKGEISGSYLYK